MNKEPIRVVVVDDQELFRAAIIAMIDSHTDFTVVGQANNGHEALTVIETVDPDVVLMDVRMPELDGVTATKELMSPLRQASRSRPLRIVMLTTFDSDGEAAAAIRYGASGYLLKDCTPGMLADAIRTVYGGGAVLSPSELTGLLGLAAVRPPAPVEFGRLNAKEREVMRGIAEGLSNGEIAEREFCAESTVKTHVGAILRKLGLRDRVQVAVYAHRHRLFE